MSISALCLWRSSVIFLLLHETFHLGVGTALCGVGFLVFHPIIEFIALEGFFAQVVGTGLALLVFWTNTKLFESNSARFDRLRLWILLTLFTCGLVLNYSHMLPFVWFFVGVYSISLAFLGRGLYGIKVCVVANILAVLATAMICPHRVVPSIQVFKVYASGLAGWFIPWMTPNYLAGLTFQNPFLEGRSAEPAHLAFSILVAVAFVFAIYIAYRNGFREIVALGLGCVAIYGGGFLLAWMGRQNGTLGGYRSFKLVSFFLPFFGAALVSLSAVVKSGYRSIDLTIKAVAVTAVMMAYTMADRIILRPTRFARVEPEFEALVGLERTTSVGSINVLDDIFWRTMWTAYFLIHKKLYFEHQTYYARSELIGDYDLEDKVGSRSEIVQVKSIGTPAVTKLNDRFTLVGPLHRRVSAKLGAGWYVGEIGHVWSGKDSKRASIILHSLDDAVRVRLRLICVPLRKDDGLVLQFRGEYLSASIDTRPDGRKEIKVSELKLNKGDNEVDIISDLDPIHPNAADPRLVSHLFTTVEVGEL